MQRLRRGIRAWAGVGVVALALGLQACGSGGGGGTKTASSPTGRVTILLTDGPSVEYDEVNVWIQSIELLANAGKALVFQSKDPGGEERNLLDLAGETELFSVQAGVPAGTYDKIRLQVARVELVRFDGAGQATRTAPKLPGNGKIDLNPRQPFTVSPGENLIVRLDVDAHKSLHVVENSQKVLFRPVVFVDVVHDLAPGKLVRIRGTVEQKAEGSFLLCPRGVSAADFGTNYDAFVRACVDVGVSEETSIFGPEGALLSFEELAVAETVEVVGRFEVAPGTSGWESLSSFHAFVVETGEYLKLKGTIQGTPETQGAATTFPFVLDPGQGVTGNLEVQTQLLDGAKLFDETGGIVSPDALGVGTRAAIDGVLLLSGDPSSPNVLKAALVIADTAPPAGSELEGVVASTSAGERAVVLEGGACAVVPLEARLFQMEEVSTGSRVEITPVGFDALTVGQHVRFFGSELGGGCLSVDVGFVLLLNE